MIFRHIRNIVTYALNHRLIDIEDEFYAINKLCDLLDLDTYQETKATIINDEEPSQLLTPILNYAVENKIIEVDTVLNRDLFEAKIMDIVIPRPSQVINQFNEIYQFNKQSATDFYYDFSQKSNYIKTSRTTKNITWKSKTKYGTFDMTINLSKPEKDPRDIIAQGKKTQSDYPKCLLCKEHVGYAQRPGRTNHRIIPIKLNKEDFYLQYSPYVYYNEHSIVLMKDHIPMNVSEKTFKRLFDFVDMFPHYFLGSNAGLPIVGGSILSHEHYQGGNHTFGIEDAKVLSETKIDSVTIKKLYWPLSVIRLESTNLDDIILKATILYNTWEKYTDQEANIYAYTDAPHNAITPIARKKDDLYILDLALRNNLTSDQFPLGIFHPHPENHHIKKENIGLIEVMGLSVLPARLKDELPVIKEALKQNKELPKDNIHYVWFTELKQKYKDQHIDDFINTEVAIKFTKCLEDSGVFKQTEFMQKRFDQFIEVYINELS